LATRYLTLRGSIKWAKVYEPDAFMGAENWKVTFYPRDDKEWDKFKASGLQLKVKTDENDGADYFQLRRPVKKVIKDDLVIFSPPEITGKVNVSYQDAEGNKVRQYTKGDGTVVTRVGDPVELGNGTEVLVNLSYYDTIKGKGHRLENITVLDLVEYISGGAEQSQEPTKEASKEDVVKVDKKELNDDIPW
jgi:hypothetical protein